MQVSGDEPGVHLEVTGAKTIAGTSRVVDTETIDKLLHAMVVEVKNDLDARGMVIRGPPVVMLVPVQDGKTSLHVGYPVDDADPAIGDVFVFPLPGGPVATTWHVGARATVHVARERLEKWLHANGHEPGACHWEILWAGWEPAGERRSPRVQVAWPVVQEE